MAAERNPARVVSARMIGRTVLLFCICVILTLLILLLVGPYFRNFYDEFGVRLPLMTRGLIEISRQLRIYQPLYWMALFTYVLLLGSCYGLALFLPSTRRRATRWITFITLAKIVLLATILILLAYPTVLLMKNLG